jgi:hypothetical protein
LGHVKLFHKKRNREDESQVDALEPFAPKVREILREYKARRKLASIAKALGFHPSRLTEMITKDGDGQYKRRITPYYLAKFFDGGFMDVKQVLGRRKLENLPDRPRLFFERMLLSRKTIKLVVAAQRRGIDVDEMLETVLSSESDE